MTGGVVVRYHHTMTTTQMPASFFTAADSVPATPTDDADHWTITVPSATAPLIAMTRLDGRTFLYRLTRVRRNGAWCVLAGARVSKSGRRIGNSCASYIGEFEVATGRALSGVQSIQVIG